jgi:hypothetical protein
MKERRRMERAHDITATTAPAAGRHPGSRSTGAANVDRNMSITNPETLSDVLGYLVLYAAWLLGCTDSGSPAGCDGLELRRRQYHSRS